MAVANLCLAVRWGKGARTLPTPAEAGVQLGYAQLAVGKERLCCLHEQRLWLAGPQTLAVGRERVCCLPQQGCRQTAIIACLTLIFFLMINFNIINNNDGDDNNDNSSYQ